MELLESVCDPYRFGLYCVSGEMPARGNVTGTIYQIAKRGGVIELRDGVPIKHWCISIGPHISVPGTDNVVVLKAMIEGEELEFRSIGNANSFHGYEWNGAPGVVNPYSEPWMPDDWRPLAQVYADKTGELPDPLELPARIAYETHEARREYDGSRAVLEVKMQDAIREGESWLMPDRGAKEAFGHGVPGMPLGRGLDPEEGLGDNEEFRRAIEREVLRELGRNNEDRGVRLWDGSRLIWNTDDEMRAFRQYGINVHDQVVLMNGEGMRRDLIEWSLLEMYGVRVENGPNFGVGADLGAYVTTGPVHPDYTFAA